MCTPGAQGAEGVVQIFSDETRDPLAKAESVLESDLSALPFQHQQKTFPAVRGPGSHARALNQDAAVCRPTGPYTICVKPPGDGQPGGPDQRQS